MSLRNLAIIALIGGGGYLAYMYWQSIQAVAMTDTSSSPPVDLDTGTDTTTLVSQDSVPVTTPTGTTSADPSLTQLKAIATAAATQYGIDPGTFRALVGAESSWNVLALSMAGAQGLTQLMPLTATQMGVTNAYDPTQNLYGGARYLASLIAQFGGISDALAAYNAGPAAVIKYGGVPPYPETMVYVAKIMFAAPFS